MISDDYPRDDYFFHYTTRQAAFEHILPTGRLRMSPYASMRDPLENKHWEFGGTYRRSAVTVSSHDLDHRNAALLDFGPRANQIKATAKLLSLTVDGPVGAGDADLFARGWSRARMWEQYAERHAGVCLLFRRDTLTASVSGSLAAQGLALPYHRNVVYTPEGPAQRLLNLDLGALAGNVTDNLVATFVEDHHDELFFLKTNDWEREYEYRFVVTAPGSDFVFVDYGDALEAVVVGECFPAWQIPGAQRACHTAHAKPSQINWSVGIPIPVPLVAPS